MTFFLLLEYMLIHYIMLLCAPTHPSLLKHSCQLGLIAPGQLNTGPISRTTINYIIPPKIALHLPIKHMKKNRGKLKLQSSHTVHRISI